MPKLIDVLKTVGADAVTYFVTDSGSNKVANNAVVAATAVATPDLIHMISNITAGVSLDNAVVAGGPAAYIAFGIYALRFVLYIMDKATAPKAA